MAYGCWCVHRFQEFLRIVTCCLKTCLKKNERLIWKKVTLSLQRSICISCKSIFDEIYHIDNDKLKEMLVNQTADSAPGNVKLATFLGTPYIGGYNHKIHNHVEVMIKSDPNLKSKFSLLCMSSSSHYNNSEYLLSLLCIDCIKEVNGIMKSGSNLKNAALLRSMTPLKQRLLVGSGGSKKRVSS